MHRQPRHMSHYRGAVRRAPWLILCASLTAGAAASSVSSRSAALSPAAKMDRYLQQQAASGEFNGSALVARNGRIVFARGYGYADRENRRPNTAETLFRLAGMTLFERVATYQLRDRGRLSLEDGVCRFVPHCPLAWRQITISSLLDGKSGLPDLWRLRAQRGPLPTVSGAVRWMKAQPLRFSVLRPGRHYDDSPAPRALLAYVISRASGMDWLTYLRRQIFARAGMRSTFTDADAPPARKAVGYILPSFRKGRDALFTRPDPVHGFWTSVGDLFRLDRALTTNALLKAATRDELFPSGTHTVEGFHAYDRPPGHVADGWYTMFGRHAPDRTFVALLMNGRKAIYSFYEIELRLAGYAVGGALRRVRPAKLPPGQLLAISGNLGVITVVSTDGRRQAALTLPYAGRGFPAAWSPDGNRLLFSRCAADACRAFVIDSNGVHEREIGAGYATGWTPDGRAIVNDFRGNIWLLTESGRRVRPSLAALRSGTGGTLVYSPDGGSILYTKRIGGQGIRTRTALMIVDTASGATRRLRDEPGFYWISSQAWSPDGARIVFTRKASPGSFEGGAYVVGSDGTGLSLLDSGAGNPPAWSPDGTRIAYNLGISCRVRIRQIETRDRHDLPFEGCRPLWKP